MLIKAHLRSLLLDLKRSLASNDTAAIEHCVRQVDSQTLLGEELLSLARIGGVSEVVRFLATLAVQNQANLPQAKWVLLAYQSIGQSRLMDGIGLPDRHVVRNTLEALIGKKPLVRAHGPTARRKGSLAEWQLAIELCLDHEEEENAAILLRELPPKIAGKAEVLGIARAVLLRHLLNSRRQRAARAGVFEILYNRSGGRQLAGVRSKLALALADSHFWGKKFPESIQWALRVDSAEDVITARFLIAQCHCHVGDLQASIAELDRILWQMTAKPHDWHDATAGSSKPKGERAFAERASKALTDLQATLDPLHKKAFLVSGTLLGYARNGAPLSHDKDVDVGIIGWEDQFDIVDALVKSGLFIVDFRGLRGHRAYCIGVDHKATGVCVDLFFYHAVGEQLITGVNHDFGYLQKFAFSKFDLQEIDFLGGTFHAPGDIDRNLTENFGNWRIPDPDYISHMESPSTMDVGGAVHMIVARLHLISAMNRKKFIKGRRAFEFFKAHSASPAAMRADLLERVDRSCLFSAEQTESRNSEEAHCE